MGLRIVYRCGYVIQGEDDDELWRNAQCGPGCRGASSPWSPPTAEPG